MRVDIQLRRDGSVLLDDTGAVRVAGPFCAVTFGSLSHGLRDAIMGLVEPASRDERSAAVLGADGPSGLLRLQMILKRLDSEGLLEHSLVAVSPSGSEFVARLTPIGRGATLVPQCSVAAADTQVKLSRFTLIQADGGALVARAPGSHLMLELGTAASACLCALSQWTAVSAIGAADPTVVGALLQLCTAAGLLAPGGQDDDVETDLAQRAQWSPADLWLHTRSRTPSSVSGYGATYRHRDRFVPLQAAPEPRGTVRYQLAVPDLDSLVVNDAPLTDVIERRQSVREHDGTHPITVGQLGELLYRSARQRSSFVSSDGQELADRPYPSGGAVHELEIYPLVTVCNGLPPGLWHYSAKSHELELMSAANPQTAALVASAREAAIMGDDPQIVLIVTARFGRVMWKYESVGYSLVLKHVGVLYQTIYLIGTAMGLAVCGTGGGDAGEFAAASGLDGYAEASVGEVVLGSAPATLPARHELPAAKGVVQR